jgi:hypothetical protein
MLQRVQAEIRDVRRLGMPVHAEHPALIVEPIVVEAHVAGIRHAHRAAF